jgi:FAD/FMN-containing dehydrogenase
LCHFEARFRRIDASGSNCDRAGRGKELVRPPQRYLLPPYLTVTVCRTKTCWLQPRCIIIPQNSVQVSQALKIASFLRTGFSVRSGGHSPNPGWASVADAVLIDLGNLNQTRISQDQRTVSVGPGALWTDVVAYLDPFGVTALAGRQPFVGVGGYTLGGENTSQDSSSCSLKKRRRRRVSLCSAVWTGS